MIIDVGNTSSQTINIGRQGENLVISVTFDFSSLVDEFGEGVLSLIVQRTKTDAPYPVVLDVSGNMATWHVTSTDTRYKGTGKVQLSFSVDEQIKKSIIYKTKVEQSIVMEDSEPAEPYESYLEKITAIGNKVQEIADDIKGLEYEDDGEGNVIISIGG